MFSPLLKLSRPKKLRKPGWRITTFTAGRKLTKDQAQLWKRGEILVNSSTAYTTTYDSPQCKSALAPSNGAYLGFSLKPNVHNPGSGKKPPERTPYMCVYQLIESVLYSLLEKIRQGLRSLPSHIQHCAMHCAIQSPRLVTLIY